MLCRPVLLPPESLVRAHTLPLKRAELTRLEQKLAEVNPPRIPPALPLEKGG